MKLAIIYKSLDYRCVKYSITLADICSPIVIIIYTCRTAEQDLLLSVNYKKRGGVIAIPLNVRDMDWELLCETVCRMDAAFERTWTYLQRVAGNSFQFMTRMVCMTVSCTQDNHTVVSARLKEQQCLNIIIYCINPVSCCAYSSYADRCTRSLK